MKKILLLLTMSFSIHCFPQNKAIDSLKHLLSISKEDTNKVWLLEALSESYAFRDDDSIVLYAQQGLQLAKKLNFKRGEVWCMYQISGVYSGNLKTDSAMLLAQQALSLAQLIGDKKGEINLRGLLGYMEWAWGDYATAIKLGYSVADYAKPAHDTSLLIYANALLGRSFRDQGDFTEALNILLSEVRMVQATDNCSGCSIFYADIGSDYYGLNKLDSALFYLNKSLTYPQFGVTGWVLLMTGRTYEKMNNNGLAFDYLRRSINTLKQIQTSITLKDLARAYTSIANLFQKTGQTDSAIYSANQALSIAKQNKNNKEVLEAYLILSSIYEKINSLTALNYYKLAIDEQNTLFNQEKQRQISGFKFDEELNQAELQNKFIQSQLQYRNRLNVYILIGGLLILLIVAGALWRRNIFKQKAYALLQKQKEEIDTRRKEAEIETALEKVRTVAMSMKARADMLEICRAIAHQLQSLNVKEIRNVQTAIFYEDKGTYMNYEYYAKHDKTFITETSYTNHEMHRAFANQMLKGNGQVFITHIKGDEVEDWIAYQKTTNVFIDSYLETASSLNYYWYSLGVVALGISTYAPLTEKEKNLFNRFLKVFGLAYRRYLDIEEAEAQAREARIEAALEKVRSRSLAMHKSDELQEVVKSVFERLDELNVELIAAIIIIFSESSKDTVWWLVNKIDQQFSKIQVPYADYAYFRDLFEVKQKGQKLLSKSYSVEEKNRFYNYLFEHTDFKKLPDERKKFILESKFFTVSVAVTKNIGIHITSHSKNLFSAEENEILKRFAKVFDQAYTRFLDLQKAEAQARENQIQLALERARTQSMIMQHSTELDDTLRVFHEQVLLLGIPSAFSFLWLPDEEKDQHIFWAAWAENNSTVFKSKAINYPLDRKEPATAQCLVDWKSNEPVVSYHVPPEGVESYFAAWSELIAGVEQLKPEYFSDGLYYVEAFMKYGCFGVMTSIDLTQDEKNILDRFATEFERAYTRFLDLQKAEASAREAQIEASLERVRSRTMGMQKSEELKEVIQVVYEQFVHLNIHVEHTGFIMDYKERDDMHIWLADKHAVPFQVTIPYFDCAHWNSFNEAKEKGLDFFANHLSFEEKNKFYQDLFKLIPGVPEETLEYYFSCPGLAISTVLLENVGLYIENFSGIPYSDEENTTLMRFGKVFQQTYTRFLDLQKAEANAREAQIEAALEKVRSRSLAMHRSDELEQVVASLFDRLVELGMSFDGAAIYLFEKEKRNVTLWVASRVSAPLKVNLPYDAEIAGNLINQDLWNAIEKDEDIINKSYSGKIKNDYYLYVGNNNKSKISEQIRTMMMEAESWTVSFAAEKNCVVGIDSWAGRTTSNEDFKIVKRFARVFEQTYTRFLDLQKAEAQAREATIEAALERVRSKTMAMHNSQDVGDTVAAVFDELIKLGIETFRCGIGIMHEPVQMEVWTAKPGAKGKADLVAGSLDMGLHPLLQSGYNGWKNKKEHSSYELKDDDLINYFTAINNHPDYPIKYDIASLPNKIFHNEFYFAEGTLFVFSLQQLSAEASQIFKRFAGVFGQTYRRYLDLQRAETNARESQIEASLERVRAKAMAMHKSKDLSSAVAAVFEELDKLDLGMTRCGIGILNKETRHAEVWTAHQSEAGNTVEVSGNESLDIHPLLQGAFNAWLKQEDFSYVLQGEDMIQYYKVVTGTNFRLPESELILSLDEVQKQYYYVATFKAGGLFAFRETEFPEEAKKLMKRFANVFDLTYTRFLDLQKAEASAKEAIKQAALDRIRADIASMRTVSDLDRITPLIWNELNILGVPFIRCGVFIMDENQQLIHTFLSTPEGKAIAAFNIPFTTPGNIQQVLNHWRHKKNYIDHWDESAFTEFANTLIKEGALTTTEQYLSTIPRGGFYLHFLPFLQGMLYVGNTTRLNDDEINLIQSVADAFSTAYARYEDFNKLEAAKKQVDYTLNELQATQAQLIQSEKMASLGELTAGIAHEIQNPLNFVNNFSEVNKEMIEEMKEELAIGNMQQAMEIADDIKDNEEKINYHGKRADAIVKGMLQHSRKSEGTKEPTDINALCDEYLPLSYHGFRAKEKDFNAEMKTGFDNSIGKINIVPQDIGRVLLNLFNNAFYAVNEKKKLLANSYQPIAEVKTRRIKDKVEITVSDNGNGIPQNIIDKIFQPFFTTKPTGQGTGLGLSLSYDIIKAHGGEIKVTTKEGEGSEFIIQLPN